VVIISAKLVGGEVLGGFELANPRKKQQQAKSQHSSIVAAQHSSTLNPNMSSKFGEKSSNEGKTNVGGGGKNTEPDDEDGNTPVAIINVTAIRVDEDNRGTQSGGPRPLEDALRLDIDFNSDTSLENAKWTLKYMVDVVAKRYIVELGTQKDVHVTDGPNTFSYVLDSIDMSGIKRKHLINNAGLFIASLCTFDDQDIIDVNLVVQVSKTEHGLVRHILNPLR
jgi:hypothetical protein